MRKVKAVVAGFEGKTMVVLTRGGEFKELPIPQYPPELGEEIEIKERTHTKSFRPYLAAAAVLLLVLALGLFNPLASPVAAYVTVDINPGIELWVEKDAKVIKIKPLSDDAEKVISGISIKDKNLYETIYAIIEKSLALGYLGKTHEKLVMVSVTPVKYQAEGSVDELRLQEAISGQLKSYQIPGYVVVNKAEDAQREQAQKKGLSVNKLLVYQQAEKRGINIPENAMIGRDMSEVLQEFNLSVKDLFGQRAVEILNEQISEHQLKAQENIPQQDEQLQQKESRQDNRSNSSGNANPDNMGPWHESTRSGDSVTDTTPVTTTKNPAGQAQSWENEQKDNTREITYPKDVKQTPGDGKGTSQESSIEKHEVKTDQSVPMEGNVKTPEKNSVLPNNQNQDKLNSTGNGGNTGGSSSGGSSGAGTGGGSSGSGNSGSSSSGSSGRGGGSWGSW